MGLISQCAWNQGLVLERRAFAAACCSGVQVQREIYFVISNRYYADLVNHSLATVVS